MYKEYAGVVFWASTFQEKCVNVTLDYRMAPNRVIFLVLFIHFNVKFSFGDFTIHGTMIDRQCTCSFKRYNNS